MAPSCSAGKPSDTSSGTNTVSKSSRKESKTASSTKLQSSEMLTTSLSPVRLKSTRVLSTWLRQAFPANHSALQVRKEAKTTKGTSVRRRSNVFAMFDPDTRSWRTSQVCLILDTLAKSSLRWPKQGSMQDGVCSEQTMWEHRTGEKDSGYWPTPTVNGNYNRKGLSKTSGDGLATAVKMWPTPAARDWHTPQGERVEKNGMGGYILRKKNKPDNTFGAGLADAVEFEGKKMWPTPTKSDHKGSGPTMVRKDGKVRGDRLDYATERNPDGSPTGGQLNPTFVEWLMGWPLGWTDLKPLETDKYQQWLQQHGKY